MINLFAYINSYKIGRVAHECSSPGGKTGCESRPGEPLFLSLIYIYVYIRALTNTVGDNYRVTNINAKYL